MTTTALPDGGVQQLMAIILGLTNRIDQMAAEHATERTNLNQQLTQAADRVVCPAKLEHAFGS